MGEPAARRILVSWRSVLLVFVGGVVGTAVRESIVLVTAASVHGRWAVLAVNLAGAFALGLLVSLLSSRDESERRRDVRFLVGVGALGGFTTYSALAVDVAARLADDPSGALAYGILSLAGGLVSAALGLAAGRRRAKPGVVR
ncbi:fluoride efflux transporter FluC [Microbacterium koreense]|uniref:Fluoride-specific ion channel FluC n=1 Tax=Microbacterium koreense TaxID=323761 RepID=A0ABW2ZUA4_9MICO